MGINIYAGAKECHNNTNDKKYRDDLRTGLIDKMLTENNHENIYAHQPVNTARSTYMHIPKFRWSQYKGCDIPGDTGGKIGHNKFKSPEHLLQSRTKKNKGKGIKQHMHETGMEKNGGH